MTKYKVSQDHDICIGCGACTAICSENWEMGDDGKANFKKANSDLECNIAAEDGCPVHCIHVKEN